MAWRCLPWWRGVALCALMLYLSTYGMLRACAAIHYRIGVEAEPCIRHYGVLEPYPYAGHGVTPNPGNPVGAYGRCMVVYLPLMHLEETAYDWVYRLRGWEIPCHAGCR